MIPRRWICTPHSCQKYHAILHFLCICLGYSFADSFHQSLCGQLHHPTQSILLYKVSRCPASSFNHPILYSPTMPSAMLIFITDFYPIDCFTSDFLNHYSRATYASHSSLYAYVLAQSCHNMELTKQLWNESVTEMTLNEWMVDRINEQRNEALLGPRLFLIWLYLPSSYWKSRNGRAECRVS